MNTNYMFLGGVAIIVVAIISTTFFSGNKDNSQLTSNSQAKIAIQNENKSTPRASSALEQMRAVSKDDHIRGDFNAPVKIIEYSDSECPFCKRFHATLQQIMSEYNETGNVTWVYRHFPITQLHAKAFNEALAMECASALGGNDKFWAYTDRLYEITPANNGLDPIELNNIAQYVGLDMKKFKTCLASKEYEQRITNDSQNAIATGGQGTPWSIIVAQNGKKYKLSGAQPYTAVKQLVEFALQEK